MIKQQGLSGDDCNARMGFIYGLFIAVLFLLYMGVSLGTPVCNGDCVTYTELMGKAPIDYIPKLFSMFRPWAVPVFFSVFGSNIPANAVHIVCAQSLIAFLAWIFFAFSCQNYFANRFVRFAVFVVIASLMFGQGYYHFNQYLLSDSLALSSVLIQLGLCLFFPHFLKWCETQENSKKLLTKYASALVVATAIEVATRDANIMLAMVGLVVVVLAGRKRMLSIKILKIMVIVMGLLALAESVPAAHRHTDNAKNILAGAILPNEEARNYFLDRGMPAELGLIGVAAKPQDLGNVNVDEVMETRRNVSQQAKWFFKKVDRIYSSYLVTHPGYVWDNLLRHWQLIFGQDFSMPANSNEATSIYVGNASPFITGGTLDISIADVFGLPIAILLVVLSGVFAVLRRDNIKYLLPLLLIVAGGGNAALAFFGDVWEHSEMLRHAFIGSIVLRIGLTLCGLLVAEEISRWKAAKGLFGFYRGSDQQSPKV